MPMTNHRVPEDIHHSHICSLPLSMFSLLKLDQNRTYRLCAGCLSFDVTFAAHQQDQGSMHIPSHLAKQLGLIENIQLNIWRSGDQICLGPVIGVLVNSQQMRRMEAGRVHQSILLHFQANMLAGSLLYYFSIGDIHWRRKQVKGYLYDPLHREWRQHWFPLPNCIYDRCISRNKRELALAEETRKLLSGLRGVSFINKGSLAKWELAKALSQSPELREHLPVTLKYRTLNDMFQMLRTYGFIFLKSSHGYGGNEVLAVKQEKNYYRLTFKKKELVTLKIKSKKKMKTLINRLIKSKPYIVQQGIEAYKLGRWHMDLRLLLQKNEQGIWKVTYNRARIAPTTDSIINSTLATYIVDYPLLTNQLKQHQMNRLPSEESVNQLAITIVKRIEEAFGSYGELGLDLIIDQTGKVWFIEANSKPTKKVYRPLLQSAGILDQFLSVLNYAKYLQKVKQSGKVHIKYLSLN